MAINEIVIDLSTSFNHFPNQSRLKVFQINNEQ